MRQVNISDHQLLHLWNLELSLFDCFLIVVSHQLRLVLILQLLNKFQPAMHVSCYQEFHRCWLCHFFSLLFNSEYYCFRLILCFSFLISSSWLLILVTLVLLMFFFSSLFSLLEWNLIISLPKSIPFPFSSKLPVLLIWGRVPK